MKAHKYSLDFTADWYRNEYFDYKLERAIDLGHKRLVTLSGNHIMSDHIIMFQYLGEVTVEINEYGQVKEVK